MLEEQDPAAASVAQAIFQWAHGHEELDLKGNRSAPNPGIAAESAPRERVLIEM
jgi:hypothetical protein